MTDSTYIIAISGPSGAGKTTATQNLVSLFGHAVSLGFDEYTEDATYPHSRQWVDSGANPDEFITPQFVAGIRSLKEGRSIVHPESKQEIQPADYIIIEEPFGKSRTAVKPLIDFHAMIDLPLEIALARRVLRIIEKTSQGEDEDKLTEFLDWYLSAGRDFYLAVQKNAAKDTDLVVDGILSTETIAQAIFDAVNVKRVSKIT